MQTENSSINVSLEDWGIY